MNRRLDVLFINPNSAKRVYQDLSKDYAAIETPTWSLLVAQSCNPSSGTTNMTGAVELSDHLKAPHPEYPITFVGSHMSALLKEVLQQHASIDIILIGEGVYVLRNAMDNIHGLKEAQNSRTKSPA